MSSFADLAAMARIAVDAVHGEVARLKPMDRARGPHGGKSASVDREEADITACFFPDTETQVRRRAQPMIGATGDRLMNRTPEILASIAASAGVAVGDVLIRDPDGAARGYEIGATTPDGIGNVIVELYAIKVT